jgi:hypothetical protein
MQVAYPTLHRFAILAGNLARRRRSRWSIAAADLGRRTA